ncbi:MAG TPA: carboxypeptidase-like regulatory domain-containing protein [Planctomycetota bacterium]|nr:carboxypeptidase-like regulatory domain-containing protein [Planctomycetota bacterium]
MRPQTTCHSTARRGWRPARPGVAPATGVVTGVARDATGRVLAGEPVAVYRDGAEDPRWPAAEATTDREGLFRFATLAGGAYAFGPSLAERAKWRSAPFSVRAGATLHHDFTARSAAQ